MTVLSWIVCYSVVAVMLQWVFNQQNIKVAFRTCLIQLILAHICASIVGFVLIFILPEQTSMSMYSTIEMVVVALTAFISLTTIMAVYHGFLDPKRIVLYMIFAALILGVYYFQSYIVYSLLDYLYGTPEEQALLLQRVNMFDVCKINNPA